MKTFSEESNQVTMQKARDKRFCRRNCFQCDFVWATMWQEKWIVRYSIPKTRKQSLIAASQLGQILCPFCNFLLIRHLTYPCIYAYLKCQLAIISGLHGPTKEAAFKTTSGEICFKALQLSYRKCEPDLAGRAGVAGEGSDEHNEDQKHHTCSYQTRAEINKLSMGDHCVSDQMSV